MGQPVAIIGGGAAAAILASTIELKLDQKWVGWILGKQGQTMKALESEAGCSITLNQDTKDAGYSTVKVHGSFNGLQTALQRIGASLDSAVAHPANADSLNGASTSGGPDTMEETVMVEQRYVGWLLGKSGIVLKEIESHSGAQVKIDQSTKDQGYSTVRIAGNAYTMIEGKRLVDEKIEQAKQMG